MNITGLLALHDKITKKSRDILEEKVRNYSGVNGDPYTNFRRVEDLGICSMEDGILARISDKFGRIITHCNCGGLVGDESFEDSIVDSINYFIFLYGCARDDNGGDLNGTE